LALTIFEYIITFGQEVDAVWQSAWTATSVLLFSTRYAMIANAFLFFVPNTSHVRLSYATRMQCQ
ncbi:uncharacterized protein PHACADRAFT_103610, partial [Phanerochaete carnosa HHB-10118-sp]